MPATDPRSTPPGARLWRQLRQGLQPAVPAVDLPERLRAALGALLGLLVTGWLTQAAVHDPAATLWLLAPLGASAVLLFAVPASPLAQPWSLLAGNIVSATVGVTTQQLIAEPHLASALAGALAIAAMLSLRCLHPPSGAVALTAVLGGPAIQRLGYTYVLFPVAINSVLLLACAMSYHLASGRRYPHAAIAPQGLPADADTAARASSFSPQDLDEVLRRHREVLTISRDDLETILRETETVAFQRRFGQLRCADVMDPVVPVEFGTPLEEAWILLREHQLGALPVVDPARRVIGMLSLAEFVEHAAPERFTQVGPRIGELIRRVTRSHNERPEVVGQVMTRRFWLVQGSQPVIELVPLLDEQAVQRIPVVDGDRRLIGMLTQAHVMHALYRSAGSAPPVAIQGLPAEGP